MESIIYMISVLISLGIEIPSLKKVLSVIDSELKFTLKNIKDVLEKIGDDYYFAIVVSLFLAGPNIGFSLMKRKQYRELIELLENGFLDKDIFLEPDENEYKLERKK